ncbi:MAG: division/cell wall cluster transcriptional repressor MraZ [Henriciella sp.]|nr:division/cell wall cluster transcriptional repressor MraZ [Henriciella sp.]
MFVSTHETSLDAKGRVSVPASFRHALGGGTRIFLWPASDGSPCLEGGGEALMATYRQTLARMSPTDPARRAFMHAIFTRSADLKMDDTGRISIPKPLLAGAGITKELVFAGSFDRFHVWAPDRFEAFDAEMAEQLETHQSAIDAPFQAALAAGGILGVVSEEEA